jgi:hypothetical protein
MKIYWNYVVKWCKLIFTDGSNTRSLPLIGRKYVNSRRFSSLSRNKKTNPWYAIKSSFSNLIICNDTLTYTRWSLIDVLLKFPLAFEHQQHLLFCFFLKISWLMWISSVWLNSWLHHKLNLKKKRLFIDVRVFE